LRSLAASHARSRDSDCARDARYDVDYLVHCAVVMILMKTFVRGTVSVISAEWETS